MTARLAAEQEELIARLIERSSPLKQEMIAFLRDRRISREFDQALATRYGEVVTGDEHGFAAFIDSFLLQHRLRNGRTPVEVFVRARGDLPRVERDMLLSWTDVVESVFEVGEADDDSVQLTNLIDELTYRVRSNMGQAGLVSFRPGMITVSRLVPVRDQWLLSGPSAVLPAQDAESMLRLAAEQAATHSEATCRNARHREQARTLQREGRERFIAHFGSDQVVLPGSQVERRLAEFAAASPQDAQHAGSLPAGLARAGTVGVIFDEHEGLGYYEEFGDLLAAFETDRPTAASLDLVREYLTDDDISPMPLLRCVRANPDRADAVFAQALRRRSFSWHRDGDALLRRYKADHLDRPPAPGISVVADRLIPYLGPNASQKG